MMQRFVGEIIHSHDGTRVTVDVASHSDLFGRLPVLATLRHATEFGLLSNSNQEEKNPKENATRKCLAHQ
jgi:hypothetical protein